MVFIQKPMEKLEITKILIEKQLKKLKKLKIAMILAGKQLRCLDTSPKP